MGAKHGQGTTPAFPVEFDLENPIQKRAWEVAQRKAKHYGVRKSLIIAFLIAVDEFEKATGREMSTDMVSGFVIARAMNNGGGVDLITQEPPTAIPRDEIIIVSSQKRTAAETADSYLRGMGNMFA